MAHNYKRQASTAQNDVRLRIIKFTAAGDNRISHFRPGFVKVLQVVFATGINNIFADTIPDIIISAKVAKVFAGVNYSFYDIH